MTQLAQGRASAEQGLARFSVPRLLLFAVVVSLPLIRPEGPNQTSLTDLFLVLLLAWSWLSFWDTRRPVRFPLIGPEWLIFVGSLVASVGSAYAVGSALTLAQDLYIYLWFVTVSNIVGPRDLPWLGQVWVLASAAEAGLIVLGAFGHVSAFANEWGRGIGTFFNPNMAASYLVTSFFVLLAVPFPRARALRPAIGALLLVAVLATGSNAAPPALVVGVAAWGLYRLIVERRRLETWLGLAALGVALLCLIVLVATQVGSIEMLSQLRGGGGLLGLTVGRLGGGVASRVAIWTGAWQSFGQHPLGLGPGVSSASLGGELHNDLLSHLAERGLLGLAGLVWGIVATFVHLGKCAPDLAGLPRSGVVAPPGPVLQRRPRNSPDPVRPARSGADWTGPLLGGFAAALPFMLSHEILHFRHHWLLLALVFSLVPRQRDAWRQAAAQAWSWLAGPVAPAK